MKKRPVILVVGAAGNLGSSVAYALLKEGKFAVRLLTPNIKSPRVKALVKSGAAVLTGEFNDKQILQEAIQDCYGFFGAVPSNESQEEQSRYINQLAVAVNNSPMRHVVIGLVAGNPPMLQRKSTTATGSHITQMQYQARQLSLPVTFIKLPCYYDFFLARHIMRYPSMPAMHFGSQPCDDPLPMVSIQDAGAVVAAVFQYPGEYVGRSMGIAGDDKTVADYTHIISEVACPGFLEPYFPVRNSDAGEPLLLNSPTRTVTGLVNLRAHLLETFGLHPATLRFEDWLKQNKDYISTIIPRLHPGRLLSLPAI